MARRTIALSTVVGLDDFGEKVVAALEELLPSLPPVYRSSIRLTSDIGQLGALRSELVALKNTEQIEGLGFRALGSDTGTLGVQSYFVGKLGNISIDNDQLEGLASEYAADTLSCIFLGESDDPKVKSDLRELCGETAIPYLVTPISGGHELSEDLLIGGVAGFLYSSVTRRDDTFGIPELERVFTFGFAGKIGLTELAKDQLARYAAQRISSHQLELAEHPTGAESRRELDAWVREHSPEGMLEELFNPRRAGLSDSERIPALVTWVPGDVEDTLVIQLDNAAVALQLDLGNPDSWAETIRNYSRTFDMSQGVRWNQMFSRSREDLGEELQKSMVSRFTEIAGSMVRPFAVCRESLQGLRAQLERGVEPEVTPERDFDFALGKLSKAAANLPNPWALFLKMALWILPAIFIGIGVFDLFYEGTRGVVFPAVYVLILLGIGIGWPMYKISRANKELMKARDLAISIMMSRQEGILAENAAGYLHELAEEIMPLVEASDAVMKRLQADIEKAKEKLEATISSDIPGALTLEPVITSPEEFRKAYTALKIDSIEWLKAAVSHNCFAVPSKQVGAESEGAVDLDSWCCARVRDASLVDLPIFADLWEIRTLCRGEGSLEEAMNEIWRRAAPYCSGAVDSEAGTFICTVDLHDLTNRYVGSSGDFQNAEVESTEDAQVLACLRSGTLDKG